MASSSSLPAVRDDRAAGPGLPAAAAATVVFLVLALWRAGAPTLWNDEVMSVSFARRSWYGLFHGAASDRVHPPLFYALLKIWIRIGGEGALWLRLLPVSIAAAAVCASGWLCRNIGLSRRASALGLFLCATSGYLVYYGQELRPYPLLLLASTLSTAFFAATAVGGAERPARSWVALALANTLLVYSHYFGWLVVGTQGLWLLLCDRRRVGRFVLSCAVPVVAFAPWAWLVSRQLHRGGGLTGNLAGLSIPGPAALASFYAGLLGPYRSAPVAAQLAAGALALAGVAVFAVRRARGGSDADAPAPAPGFLSAFAFAPPAVAFLFSVLLRPVFHPRYLIEAAVPALLLAGAALASFPPGSARLVAAGAAVACCAWGAAGTLAEPTRIAWGDLVVAVRDPRCAAANPGATIYALGEGTPRPVAYYVERARISRPVLQVLSLDEIRPRAGWLAFHAGAELEGISYWSAATPESVRAALARNGLRVLCEQSSGPARRRGVLVAFAPAGGGP